MHVGEAVVLAAQRRLPIILAQSLERAMHLAQFGVRQRMSVLGAGRDRRVADLVKTELAAQMRMNGLDGGVARAEGHPGAHGPRAIAVEQHAHLAGDGVVGSPPPDALAMPIVQRLGAVHGYRDPEAVRVEEVDQRGCQQRRVRRQRKIHLLPRAARLRLRVRGHLPDQRDVGERLAAEEDHVQPIARGARRQQEVDASRRGHEVHLSPVDGLGEVFLVAIGARQIAASVDVENERAQRIRGDLDTGGIDRPQAARRLQHLESAQLRRECPHPRRLETRGQGADQVIDASTTRGSAKFDDLERHRIHTEHRGGRHVQKIIAGLRVHQVAVPRIPFETFCGGVHGAQ